MMSLEERRKIARRKWYESNKPAILARQTAYQKALSPEKKKAIQQRWRDRNRESERLRARKKNHRNLPTPTRAEPTSCECCGKPDRRALALDHCHETGQFRGWLCSNCNLGIGKIGDSIEALERALAYLKRGRQ